MLTLGVVLGLVQTVAASNAASLQRGYRWTSVPRDEPTPPLRGLAGRLDRALRNFLETFPLFATVVLVAHVSETHDALTEWGSRLYLWGRVAYVPLYAAGVPLVRSPGTSRPSAYSSLSSRSSCGSPAGGGRSSPESRSLPR